MKTLTKSLLAAAALATVAGGYALAQQGPGPGGCPMGGPGAMMGAGPGMMGGWGGPMHGMKGAKFDRTAMVDRIFEALDTNKDGVITLDEVIAKADARFDEIDANHDGVIDRTEAATWIGRRAPAKAVDAFMAHHDLDGDGKITKAEWEKPIKKRFALYDRNDDGKITKEEALLDLPPAGMGRHGHGFGPMGGGMMGGAPWAAPQAPEKAK